MRKQQRARRGAIEWCSVLVALGWVIPSAAQGVDRQARVWASACVTCHAPVEGPQGAIPAIAGRDGDLLWRTLIEFKTGQRPAATVMHQHAKGYSDDELKRIARYLASTTTP